MARSRPSSQGAARVIRPGGRLLVVHDYGRDDVSRLRGDLPEYGLWTRRDGPFLRSGFKIRVIHCFWTFDSIEDAAGFLGAAFGEIGREVGAELEASPPVVQRGGLSPDVLTIAGTLRP